MLLVTGLAIPATVPAQRVEIDRKEQRSQAQGNPRAQQVQEATKNQAQVQREKAQAQANAKARAQAQAQAEREKARAAASQAREQRAMAQNRGNATTEAQSPAETAAPASEGNPNTALTEPTERATEVTESAGQSVEMAREAAAGTAEASTGTAEMAREATTETAESVTGTTQGATDAQMEARSEAASAEAQARFEAQQTQSSSNSRMTAEAEAETGTPPIAETGASADSENTSEEAMAERATAATDADVATPASTDNPRQTTAPNANTTAATAAKTAAADKNRGQRPADARANRVLDETTQRNRAADRERAEQIDDDDDAKSLLYSILGGAAAGAIAAKVATSGEDDYRRGRRLPANVVGRSSRERERSVDYFTRRFRGDADYDDDPYYREHHRRGHRYHQPHYYDGDRRVVWYASRNDIPPYLIASNQLNYVNVAPVRDSGYRPAYERGDQYVNEVPPAYYDQNAYAVSYEVDPDSVVSRDDILFQQGSTAFADAYSYDIVLDLAEAMNSSELQNERFIIEGHASAEGDYGSNLKLSQERAERIARDLVAYGIDANRLVPVGYGEAEANSPANAPEPERALDRRVMVFRSK